MKFILLINAKMPTVVDISTFISKINTTSVSSKARFQYFSFYGKSCSSHDFTLQKVSEYDQEIPQLHAADQHTAPWGRATEHL